METFNPDRQSINSYRSTICQRGAGSIDRYIYSQNGEGIASFFGNLFRTVAPILGQAIKGAAQIAKPHLQRAATDIVTTGSKRALEKISGDIQRKLSTPKTKRRKRMSAVKTKHNHNLSRK